MSALLRPSTMELTNSIIGVHYKVGKKIGEGSFGIIYEGNDLAEWDLRVFYLFFFYRYQLAE